MKVFVLSYASFSCVDYQIYSETLGIYSTEEEAITAMQINLTQDIKDGDSEDDWDVYPLSAEYNNDYSDDYKCYKIKEMAL